MRRFLAIFYPPAEYEKLNLTIKSGSEYFFASEKYLKEPGYLSLMEYSFRKKKTATADAKEAAAVDNGSEENEGEEDENLNINMAEVLAQIKKGDEVGIGSMQIKEGETSPPKQLQFRCYDPCHGKCRATDRDEELRSQIKGSGIGTSATRAEILKKLVNNKYIALNKKTQIYTPTLQGENDL